LLQQVISASLLFFLLGFGLFTPNSSKCPSQTLELTNSTTTDGWAVLLEMNEYPGNITDLPTYYSDSRKWVQTLLALGWTLDHIHIINGELTKFVVESSIDFLQLHADYDDIVLFYILAHGGWINSYIEWLDWVPEEWSRLSSQRKVLVISACSAEVFIRPMENDCNPHIHLVAAGEGEFAWAGFPKENLPIISEVFNHFLTSAFLNYSADTNQNEEISVEEGYAFALPKTLNYIVNIVFPAFPDMAELCNNTPPHPVMDDNYEGELSLRLDKKFLLPESLQLIILGCVIGATVVLTGFLFFKTILRRNHQRSD
jgi:hypothetical protein